MTEICVCPPLHPPVTLALVVVAQNIGRYDRDLSFSWVLPTSPSHGTGCASLSFWLTQKVSERTDIQ